MTVFGDAAKNLETWDMNSIKLTTVKNMSFLKGQQVRGDKQHEET